MSGATVNVRLPDGRIGTVPAANVSTLPEGSAVLSAEEMRAAERAEKQGGILNAAAAWQNAGIQGATADLGLAAVKSGLDVVSPELGAAYGRDVLAKEEEYPTLTTVGKVGGAIAGAAIGAASGGAAGGAGRLLPSAAIDSLGAGLGRGAAGALGGLAERGLAGEMAAGAASGAIRGAAEGALYGAGHEVGEAVLGDHELTAEKLLAGAKEGAIFGGVIGGGAGGLSPLAGRARESLADVLGGRTVKDLITGQAELHALDSFNPTATDYRKLGSSAETATARAKRIGRTALDEGLADVTLSTEKRAAAIERRLSEVGEQMGAIDRRLDTAPAELRPRVAPAIKAAQDEIARISLTSDGVPRPLTSVQKGQIRELTAYAKQLEQMGDTASFADMRRQISDLGKSVFQKGPPSADKDRLAALMPVWGAMKDEMMRAGDAAADHVGGAFRAEYQAKNALYSDLSQLNKFVERDAARHMAAPALSFGDQMMGAGGMAAMGPKGLLVAGARKLLRERGDQIAAKLYDRVGALLKMADANAEVDRKVFQGVDAFLSRKSPPPANTNSAEPARRTYAARAAAITAIASNPAMHSKRIEQATSTLADTAPKTAGAVAMQSARAIQYLAATMPKGNHDPYSPTPQLERSTVSDAEASAWLRRFRAANDPLSVLDDMRHGRLSKESVDTIKVTSPKLYEQMRGEVAKQLADRDHPLAYSQKIQLGIMFDMPTDASMAPDFIKAVQASFAAPPPKPSPPGGDADIVSPMATATQKLELK